MGLNYPLRTSNSVQMEVVALYCCTALLELNVVQLKFVYSVIALVKNLWVIN